MGPSIQWVQSYVTDDKIYCVYVAPDEETVRRPPGQGGFPAEPVARVRAVIDPVTAESERDCSLSPGGAGSCPPGEARRPLLAEGGDAFRAVRGAGGDRLVARLHVQDVLERHAESLVESRLGQPVRHGRPLGQPLGELQRLLLELLRGDHAIHEADAQRLLRVDDV